MSILEDLRKVQTFEDLPEDHLAWLAQQGTEIRLQPGDVLTLRGRPGR